MLQNSNSEEWNYGRGTSCSTNGQLRYRNEPVLLGWDFVLNAEALGRMSGGGNYKLQLEKGLRADVRHRMSVETWPKRHERTVPSC